MTSRRPALLFLLLALAAPGLALAIDRREVEIKAEDGFVLRGTFYDYRGTGPGVLFLSDCTAKRSSFQTLAAKISAAGIRVLTFDSRGQGPAELTKRAGDVDAAYRFFALQPGIDSPSIGVFGAGCGAAEAMLFAARHPDKVRSMALLSTDADQRAAKTLDALSRIPLLLIASEGDQRATGITRQLFDRSRVPISRLVLYKGAAHGVALYDQDEALKEEVAGWFATTLLPAGAMGR